MFVETEFAGRLKFRWDGLKFTCSSHQELLIVNFDFALTLGICILARDFVDVAFVCRRDLKLRASVPTVSIYIARCFAWLIKLMIQLGSSNPDARPGRVHRMSFNSIGQPSTPGMPRTSRCLGNYIRPKCKCQVQIQNRRAIVHAGKRISKYISTSWEFEIQKLTIRLLSNSLRSILSLKR